MDNLNNPEDIDEESHEESIAVIGMSGRFPGAKNIDEFWQNLKNGVESISFFSEQELLASGIDPASLKENNYVKAKGALDNVTEFDAAFFDFSPKEAEITDPQQRLFLECAWEALENAGYDPKTYTGSIGVYGGVGGLHTYLFKNLYANQELRKTIGDFQLFTNNNNDFVCTRVSYKLNLSGPSITVQTACSTSLVAVVMGYQSLLDYQCDMVLVGGAAISLPQKSGYFYQEGFIHSPDGHCRAFDASAQGTVEGNGVGIVVLKRLSDALMDGDHIHAIIRSATINNDGASKVGFTAPSMDAQARAIVEALTLADISPETISYVETHGTATPLGDPIELGALTQAFRTKTDKKGYCAIGSVKTNIGHLDAAAGIANFIKTVLALEHQLLPPSLHFETPNPKLDLANTPFYVNAKLSEWKTNGFPRRAGVNSLGIGGTNAHVILEEASNPKSEIQNPQSKRPWQLLLLSAKTNTALETITAQLIKHLKLHPELNLADVAYTYQIGRSALNQRRMLVCQTVEDAINALETQDAKRVLTQTINTDAEPAVVFMFSGQGSQYVNMALELYQIESVFREQIDHCAEFLKPHLGLDLRTILYPNQEQQTEVATEKLKQTAVTQPALFVIEYALAQLWKSWGVQPKAMIGHSIGEYVAACLAGVFTLEEALVLVATRGRLIQSVPAGTMLAVPLTEEKIRPFLNQNLNLAALNVPSQSVVSGSLEAIEQLTTKLALQGVECQRLHTSHAFHSEMMEPILPLFLEQVQKISLKPPQIPFLSNVTGSWISNVEATVPNYWVTHLRQTVRFATGLQQVLQEPQYILLEVGPGRTLSTFAKRHPNNIGQLVLTSLPHSQDKQSDHALLLNTLGQLWLAGITVNWSGFYADEQRYRLPLPTYPFERQRYWIEAPTQQKLREFFPNSEFLNSPVFLAQASSAEVSAPSALLKKRPNIADWFYIPSWQRSVLPNHSENQVSSQQCWLVFVDEYGLGSKIVQRLEQQNQYVVMVKEGSVFSTSNNDHTYTLNPQLASDYDALLKALYTRNQIPTTIVHLWNVTSQENIPSDNIAKLEQYQNKGFYSLLFLAQTLGKQSMTNTIQIDVVSNHLQQVVGDEILCPEKATLLGPCRVIPHEYPNINCRSIDVVFPASGETLVEQLLSEILVKPQSESMIAYRNHERWVQTFQQIQLDETSTSRLRKNGVYLITGGLGGIGLVLAEYLAKTVQAKLILTTHSFFPEKELWVKWLNRHDEQDKISHKIKKIQALEAIGTEVLIVSANITSLAQMSVAINQSLEKFGSIHGVIHAAGVFPSGMIQLKTPEMAEKILAPKVKGTLILDIVLKEQKLDFLILCSSLTAILGGLGMVEHCGANAFLDAFAHRNISQPEKLTISINWDAWQEVGIAAEAAAAKQGMDISNGLLPSEGMDIFQRVLGHQGSQFIVSTTDLIPRIEKENSSSILSFSEKSTLAPKLHLRPQLGTGYIAPDNEFEQMLTNIWEKFLGIEQIGVQDNFFELGGDSLIAVQLVSELRRVIKVELSSHSLLETPTIASLAKSIKVIQTSFQVTQEQDLPPCLVTIQTGSPHKPPLFLIHPAGGHVYFYRDLAHKLGTEQPVYGLQAQGVDEESLPLQQSVEEIASQYLTALRTIQPNGPYLLGGASFGGTVAFEMAQQLQKIEQKVALLIMIDTPSLGHMPTRIFENDVIILSYLLQVGDNLYISPDELQQLSTEQQLNYLLAYGKMVHKIFPDTTLTQLRHFLDFFRFNVQAMLKYRPQVYSGKIIFFRAQERDEFNPQHPEIGWFDCVTDGIEIHQVPGNHITMNYSPHVEVMAKRLKNYLDKV